MRNSRHRPTKWERLVYGFDSSLAGGPIVLIGWLAVVSTILILGLAALVWITGIAPVDTKGARPSFVMLVWMGLLRTLDAGTMGNDSGSWQFLLAMLGATLIGIFVISILIGTLSGVIDKKMSDLRKGRSRVLESGHTVILGWAQQVFTIISELVIANQNQKRASIVILGDRDKAEMEDAIRERIPDLKTTKLICRSGNPLDIGDLEIASLQKSKSIILLSPAGSFADAEIIKVLLAITNSSFRRESPYLCVAELRDPRNLSVARLVGGSEASLVVVPELLARLTVQTSRQSGLSVVYQELFDFAGDEIYYKEEPALVGKLFGDILSLYINSSVIGLWRTGDVLMINPPMQTPICQGDKLIAISADDDMIVLHGHPEEIDEEAIVDSCLLKLRNPEHTLVLGWNINAPMILRELDHYVAPGSKVQVLSEFTSGIEICQSQCPPATKIQVSFLEGDTTDREVLDQLNIPSFDQVILLSPEENEDDACNQRADSRTLITLVHLRNIREKSGSKFSIVSEMRDPRNRALAEVSIADDFIVGDQIVGLLMSQISENKDVASVFNYLLDAEGSEIYLKPVDDYVLLGREVSFFTVLESVRRRGQVAIGYRQQRFSYSKDRSYGIVVNPCKSARLAFEPGDSLIIIAEE